VLVNIRKSFAIFAGMLFIVLMAGSLLELSWVRAANDASKGVSPADRNGDSTQFLPTENRKSGNTTAASSLAGPPFRLFLPMIVLRCNSHPWNMLAFVYKNIDADYVDTTGVPKHLTATMPQSDAVNMVADFMRVPQGGIACKYSDTYGEVLSQIVFISRPITHVSYVWAPDPSRGYWVSPDDVRPELNQYAPPGAFDSIEIFWQASDPQTSQSIPSAGWGWGMGPSASANGSTYATVFNLSWWWTLDPCNGEVFLHEWLHGVTGFYMSLHFPFPPGDLHGAEQAGYVQDPNGCWTTWLRDYMRGRVYVNGIPTGISKAAWDSGSVLSRR
jgi:hypothetical protein